jgi:hypothetical protein
MVWRPTLQHFALSVVCKASYVLTAGVSALAEAADELVLDDLVSQDDAAAMVLHPADVAPFKHRAELLLVGHPGGRALMPSEAASHGIEAGGVRKMVPAGCFSSPLAAFGARAHGVVRRLVLMAEPWDHQGIGALPALDGVDPLQFNVAAPDQQAEAFAPVLDLTLVNLLPGSAQLTTRLAPARPRIFIERSGGGVRELPARCDTLLIDVDRGVASLVWRAGLWLEDWEPPRFRVTAELPETPPAEAPSPFDTTAQAEVSDLDTTAPVTALELGDSLPFEPAASGHAQLPRSLLDATGARPAAGMTLFEGELDLEASLPFGPPPALPPPPPHAWPSPPAPIAAPPSPVARAAWSPSSASPSTPVAPPRVGPSTPAEAEPAPPPAPLLAEPEPPAAADLPAEPEPLPIDDFPAARCAAIAATLAHRPGARDETLAAHQLRLEVWDALDRHWIDEMRAEAKRGASALTRSYDHAYVEALERARGPISVDDYAALTVAMERGVEKDKLAELDLPGAALLRVKRVWLGRLATDLPLGKAVRAAIAQARR